MKKILNKSSKTKLGLLAIGFISTIWFLVRVIPKPSRALYPCMKATAPFMSAFVVYLISLGTTVFAFRKTRQNLVKARYVVAGVFFLVFILSVGLTLTQNKNFAKATTYLGIDEDFPLPSNDPIGTAKGLFPGRVVWVHDMEATNKNYDPQKAGNSWWSSNSNTDLNVVNSMLSTAIMNYASENDIKTAWNAIITHFNEKQGKGSVGYTPGEKIAIKLNLTNAGSNYSAERMNSTPQLAYAILYQLTEYVGVAQEDITMGDPYRQFHEVYKEMLFDVFPDVNYVGSQASSGVKQTVKSSEEVLKFANGHRSSTLPQYYLDADYFINMPCLKTHDSAGITLVAKNHQGSFCPADMGVESQYAIEMHDYLPVSSAGRGKYRHLVDYLGHKDTDGKGLLSIVDGIWAGESWQGWIEKYKMAPFNNDYPNSIFVSQDPVALESVCWDILFEEYATDPNKTNYPNIYKEEDADYLLQCASSDYWPTGVEYDPEGDGTPIGSLGVLEHWNDAVNKQYTRNLGTGDGVELVYLSHEQTAQAFHTVKTKVSGNGNVNLSFASFEEGQEITLMATPDNGYVFEGWSGDLTSTNASEKLVMDADKNVTATFVKKSTSIRKVTESAVVKVLSNPFSVFTTVEMNGEHNLNTKMNIYDLAGSHISTLLLNDENKFTWDATNSLGKKVNQGTYLFTIMNDKGQLLYTGKLVYRE